MLSSLLYAGFNVVEVESSSDYRAAPDFILTDIDGNTFSLSCCLGKVVLLDFFFTLCGPCVEEMSHIEILFEEFGGRLFVISISSEDETVLRSFREEHSIEWMIAKDTANVSKAYGISAFPTLVIIDRQGYICYAHVGLTEASVLRPEIESLLSNTIYVDDDNVAGPWNGTEEYPYQNMTSGLEHASANDTIFVRAGIYYEHMVVYKSMSLIGEKSDITIIDGNHTGIVLNITANNVEVNGFTVQNSGSSESGIHISSSGNTISNNIVINNYWSGIELSNYSNNNTLCGNKVLNNTYGIKLYNHCNTNTIIGNNILENGYGIYLDKSDNNFIASNDASNKWWGIYIDKSTNNTLVGNNAFNNSGDFGVWGDDYSHFTNNVDTSNTVDGKPIYYLKNVVDTVIGSKTNAGTVYLINCNNITVVNLTLRKNGNGVFLWNTTNSKIENVTASNCIAGTGIRCHLSNGNILVGNNVSNNALGIKLYDCNNNTIFRNTVCSNNYFGIELQDAYRNMIYHNNFINNYHQKRHYNSLTTWDNGYPSGGNYWSDYVGVDIFSGPHQNLNGSDGISDAAYDKIDNYPLMGVFSVFSATLEHHIATICNSTISKFKFDQLNNIISFNVTGQDVTSGFCRICIPKILMNDTYEVLVNGTKIPRTILQCSNSTHTYLYFTYHHSTQKIVIIPQFPSSLMLLFMIATLLAVMIHKRKHTVQKKKATT